MIYTYPAIFMKYEKDESYGIYFPDFGSMTHGKDLNDAMAMAIDLLALQISVRKDNVDDIPSPSNINSIDCTSYINKLENNFTEKEKQEDRIIESFANYVSVDVEEYAKKYITKYDKKTLTIPHWLNIKAQEKGINFSKTLTKALLEILKI